MAGDTGINMGTPMMLMVAMMMMSMMASMMTTTPGGGGGAKTYPCEYCGYGFSTYEELLAHVQSVHPGERVPVEVVWS